MFYWKKTELPLLQKAFIFLISHHYDKANNPYLKIETEFSR